MKKIVFLIATVILSCQAKAQLANPDFEIVNNFGLPGHWNPALFMAIPIDPSCIGHGMDSLYFLTSDAYSGQHALELRTGSYCGNIYPGNIRPTKDDSDTDFYNQSVPFVDRPLSCSFYYKFFPVQGDLGKIQVHLADADGVHTADAYYEISEETQKWTRAEIPLTYSENSPSAFLDMRFEIANDTALHYGSRFLIDQVRFNMATGIGDARKNDGMTLTCYPVPATNEIYILLGSKMNTDRAAVRITDAAGRIVKQAAVVTVSNNRIKMAVPDLTAGVYFLDVTAHGISAKGKFVK